MNLKTKQDLIRFLFEKEVLVNPTDFLSLEESQILDLGKILSEPEFVLSAENLFSALKEVKSKQKINIELVAKNTEQNKINYGVEILESYRDVAKKRDVQDFVKLLYNRYKVLSEILRTRSDLVNLTSINKIGDKKDSGELSLIGLVKDLRETKNGHKIIELEDPTGTINVLITKNNEDLFNVAKEVVLDEVLAVSGQAGENILFCKKILFPDVPLSKELKKSPDEVYAILISDIHVGSKSFMRDEFERFLDWLNGNVGTDDQKRIAAKIKYVLIPGDIIDGVGVFPNQQDTLETEDVRRQYVDCAKLLKKIPLHMSIIMCPGNHDPLRLAEPQPILAKEYAAPIIDMPNVTIVTNPGRVRIHKKDNFPGFEVLLYHGGSYFYYADKVESLRKLGGAADIAHTMRFLLQKRHLAPTHASTQFIPDPTKDPLLIKDVPDFFVSGHVHKASVVNYRNVTSICGSCWDGISEYAVKFGSLPEPGRVVLINLQTREVKIMKFITDEREEEMKKNAQVQ